MTAPPAEPIRVIHFSDVLCVWAYVSQVRVDELRDKLGDDVLIDVRFCSVFGDSHTKIKTGWAQRGGFSGYGAHVRDIADEYKHPVHSDAWRKLAPRSSLSCQVFLCAVRTLERRGALTSGGGDLFNRACWGVRQAFFRDLRDISNSRVQLEIAAELSIPVDAVTECIATGEAHAELSKDYDSAREFAVTVSPTFILNEGRQRLNGNVSFGVISANVTELLTNRDAACST